MKEFRGCFKEVGKINNDKMIEVDNYILMSAPNRYRKLLQGISLSNKSPDLSKIIDEKYDNQAAIEIQLKDFPNLHNPIGFQFDLYDTYIAWEKNK